MSAAAAADDDDQPMTAAAAAASAAESGATWCRRAARAVRQRVADAGQLVREYQYVVALDDGIRHGTRDATRAEAAGRNRYTNVLPYDYNRVRLPRSSSSGTGGGGSGSTYINASRIALPPAAPSAPAGYIATQGPLPNTAEHFWAMAVDAGAPAIVMLTNCIEKGSIKCVRYFPDAPGDTVTYGGVTLTVEARDRFSGDCDRRTLRVELEGAPRAHTLQHFHYHAWPDHGVPADSATLRALCREVQRLVPPASTTPPAGGADGSAALDGGGAAAAAAAAPAPLVHCSSSATPVLHCSAGIGRTGTFIAVDALLRRIDAWFRPGGPTKGEVEAALDVPLLVHSLRQQRGGMVQTLEQYAFVYRAALDELDARAAPAPGAAAAGS